MIRIASRLAAFLALFALVSLAGPALAQDAKGDWKGAFTVAPNVELRLVIHLTAAPDGRLTGTLDSLDQGAYSVALSDVVAKDGKLSFSDTKTGGKFAADWDAGAHAWKGVWSQGGHDLPLVLGAGVYPDPPAISGLDGEWDGALNMGVGLSLRMAFHVRTDQHGTRVTIDSVDQGAYGAAASSITRDGDDVRIAMTAKGAVYEAKLVDDSQTLAGVFTQDHQQFPLTLKRLPAGQPSPWPRPATPTPASTPPADWQPPSDAEIRQLLVDRIDTQHQGVGIVVGVIDAKGRRVIAYGKSDSANGRALDGDSEFEIGSITKVFTSLVLADMASKDEVKLDDPIATYLPPGVIAPQKDGKSITLVDLATHTSGLPRMPTNFAPKAPDNPFADYSYDQLWAFLSSYELPRDPGASWEYSNLGFGLLGDLLARRAGTDYQTLLKARVLGPLGMTSTTITLTPDEQARLTAGHDSYLRPVANWDLPTLAGAGALRSTANDLMSFLAAEMGLTSSPLQADMADTLAVRRPTGTPEMEQALGWEVLHLPNADIVQHNGGTGGYHTLVAFNPKTKVGVVVLTNAETDAGADDIGLHILTGAPVLNLPPPAPPPPERHAVTLDAKALDALTGTYVLAPQANIVVTRDGDHLMAQLTGQGAFEVFPESPTEVFWKVVDAQATFILGKDGRATSLVLHQNGRDLPGPRAP